MTIQENVSLKPYNTFGFDIKTRYFAELCQRDELPGFLQWHAGVGCPLLLLGGGSNLLFTVDFPGCVLKISTKGMHFRAMDDDTVLATAEAGEDWDGFVQACIDRGLGGLENLSKIPGNAGSSPIQNIGAYGVEMKDHFHSLEAIELKTGAIKTFRKEDCAFGYRSSLFKQEARGQYLILSVCFALQKNPVINTSYGAIREELERMGVQKPGIADIAQAITNIRDSKLPDPRQLGNAGSFFKNPTVSAFDYYRIRNLNANVVAYNLFDGTYKLAAGWLIEQCGWKGQRVGDAGVHEKQALILVNYGTATGQDIYDLSEEIIRSVQEKFGVALEREVNVVSE